MRLSLGAMAFLLIAPAAASAGEPVERALDAWRADLPALRIEEPDLFLPSTVPPYLPIAAVETFFSTPLAFPPAASGWLDRVEGAEGLGGLHGVALTILDLPPGSPPAPTRPIDLPAMPPELRAALSAVTQAIAEAQPMVSSAAASVDDEARRRFAALYGWPQDGVLPAGEVSTQRLKKRLAALGGFRETAMQAGARRVFAAVDEAVEFLDGADVGAAPPARWKSSIGEIVIGGAGDDVYDAAALKDVVVLIDLGGDNRYEGPVAYAGPGEIRVAIDLGTNVTVAGSTTAPTAGASFFGVAALALAHPTGAKRLATGDFSQGATIGGAAGLWVRGTCDARAGRHAQGAAAAGAGIFAASGAGSRYEAQGSAQGIGFARGVGVFRHAGNDARVEGGLVEPDPREPQGALSLCQGVGVGRRALSGGGVGLCSLSGNDITAIASYFAHGVGYWHAAGAFRLRGRGGLVQGRRYAQGSGIHSAFGHFEALGDENRTINWGAGPSHGWDRGVGSAVIVGDRVEVQTDWALGNAQVGGRAFGFFDGKDGRHKLSWIGTGNFFRNEPAYSVQVVSGGPHANENAAAPAALLSGRAMPNPWGVQRLSDVTFAPSLGLKPAVWPELKRKELAAREATDLGGELSASRAMDTVEAVSAVADVAAAFSVDAVTPRQALKLLLAMPDDRAPFLAGALEPAAIEQLIQLSIALAAHGDASAAALSAVAVDDPRRPLALHLLRLHRPSVAAPALEAALDSTDKKVAAAAVKSLGLLLNRDTGEEPGALAALETISAALAGGSRARKRAAAILARVRLTEGLGALSSAALINAEERIALLDAGPDDVTERLGPGGAEALITIAAAHKDSRERLAAEIEAAAKVRERVRSRFESLSRSTETTVVAAAVAAAGQTGDERDAAWIEPLIEHPRAAVREAAVVALGRLGEGGYPALLRAVKSPSPRTRALAALGAQHGVSRKTAAVVAAALDDPDPLVASTAAAVMFNPNDALLPAMPSLRKKAARRLKKATDRDLKTSLRLLLRR